MRERILLAPTGLDQFFLSQIVQFEAYILYKYPSTLTEDGLHLIRVIHIVNNRKCRRRTAKSLSHLGYTGWLTIM